MRKDVSKVFLLGLFSLLCIGMFSVSVVAAIFDPVKNILFDWEQGNLSINVAKYSFMFLITLIIYTLLGFIPVLGKNADGEKRNIFFLLLISFVISFLSTAYLTPQNVYGILMSYGAVGIVVGGIIPILIIFVFTKQLDADKSMSPYVSKFIWIAFVFFIGYKLVEGSIEDRIGNWELIIYFVLMAIGLVMAMWAHKINYYMFREHMKNVKSESQSTALAEMDTKLEILRDEILATTDDKKAAFLKKKFNGMIKRENELGGNWERWKS